jgi:hypothetical protein
MRYLQCGFVGEGRTDYAFFKPLVGRVVEDLVLRGTDEEVQIADILEVRPGDRMSNAPNEVVHELTTRSEYLDVVFYHADAAGDVEGAYSSRVKIVQAGVPSSMHVVGVIPKRETEAWVLADPACVAAALGLQETALQVGTSHRPDRVEAVPDPKREFRELVSSARPKRRRRTAVAETCYRFLGQLSISLSCVGFPRAAGS